jgi:hypothetical protein
MNYKNGAILVQDVDHLQPAAATTAASRQILAVASIIGPSTADYLLRLLPGNPVPSNVADIPRVTAKVHSEYLRRDSERSIVR